MKQLKIKTSTIRRIQAIAMAKPLTADDIINQALDAWERKERNTPTPNVVLTYDSLNLPDLYHTKILDWKCELPAPQRLRWSLIARCLLDEAVKSVDHISELPLRGKNSTHSPKRTITDFGELPVRGMIQSGNKLRFGPMNANGAGMNIVALVKFLKIQVEILFQWRDKPEVDANFRGKKALLRIP